MLEKKEIGKWKGMDALRAEMVAIRHGRWLENITDSARFSDHFPMT
jgi:hypothetical protein